MPLRPFEAIVGKEFVRETPGEELDGIPVVGEIAPGSPEEIAGCLRAARESGQALVPCGGRSKLGLGNRADARDLLRISLERLSGPLEIEPAEGVGRAGAGVAVERLRAGCRSVGRRTLLETPHDAATVGGTIAADAFGARLGPGARLRDDLLGIRVALPDGTLARSGGRVVKNVTGFDLVRLHCGACGTLGVITEAIFRLRPTPEGVRILSRELNSAERALADAGSLLRCGVEPEGVVILPAERGARLLWALEGTSRDVASRAARFDGEAADEAAWREAERGIAGEAAPGSARVRLLGRASDSASLWAALCETGGRPRLALPMAGILLGDLPEEKAPEAVQSVRSTGVVLLVEEASPTLKARLEVFGLDSDSLPLMASLKERFDPVRVLAPGRFAGRI
jgi:glycolate oxidase FAD binding subunit